MLVSEQSRHILMEVEKMGRKRKVKMESRVCPCCGREFPSTFTATNVEAQLRKAKLIQAKLKEITEFTEVHKSENANIEEHLGDISTSMPELQEALEYIEGRLYEIKSELGGE